MESDKITIIMPVYKVERFIRDAINSVLIQSTEYGPLEFIIVDDGSPDNCPKIIDEMISNYQGDIECVVIHKKNEGVRIARNDALDRATGNWIMFIDSDDRFEPDAIRVFREYMEKYPEADYFQAAGNDVAVDEGVVAMPENYLMDRFYPYYEGDNAKFFLFCCFRGPHVTPWAKLYRRDIIGNEKFKDILKLSDDFEFNMRVWRNVNYAVCIKDIVYIRNKQKDSIVVKGLDAERKFFNEVNILNEMTKSYDNVNFSTMSESWINVQRYVICRYIRHMEWMFSTFLDEESLQELKIPAETDNKVVSLLKVLGMPEVLSIYRNIQLNPEKKSRGLKRYQLIVSKTDIFNRNGNN